MKITMTFNKRKDNHRTVLALGIVLMLLIPSVGTSIWQTVYGNITSPLSNQNTEGNFMGSKLFSPPELSQIEKNDIIEKAMNYPELKKWSSNGWEVASISFAGSTEPTLNWDTVSVILKLPSGKGTPLASCSTGWDATIIMDLKTKKIIDAWYPKDPLTSCDGDWNKSGIIDESLLVPSFIPQADATNVWFVAQENDVTSGPPYERSNLSYINTPTFTSTIYTNMNKYVAHYLNQKWNNDAFTQEGYTISTLSGCPTCGFGSNSAVIAYIDTATYGNTYAHKVADPLMVYSGNTNLLVQSSCNYPSPTNYKLQFTYNGRTWQFLSGVPCTAILKTDAFNNSSFFENANTVSTNGWASNITGTIKAWSAKEETTAGALNDWAVSNNKYIKCDGTNGNTSTSNMTGTLASAGTATWLVTTMAKAC